MGGPKRNVLATAEETLTPPPSLSDGQSIARVVKGQGKNLYSVELPSGKSILAELPSRFRSTIWLMRGGYVLVDTKAFNDRDNKLQGEIVNVVRDEKQWRKETYWSVLSTGSSSLGAAQLNHASRIRPKEFTRKASYLNGEDEDDSVVGKMPPSSESEGDL